MSDTISTTEPHVPTHEDDISRNNALDGVQATTASSARLDADIYNAEDLDGITESLFGSGNLNYLTLQSRQTDSLMNGGGGGDGGNGGLDLAGENDAAANGGRMLAALSGDGTGQFRSNTLYGTRTDNDSSDDSQITNIRTAENGRDGTSFGGNDGNNGVNAKSSDFRSSTSDSSFIQTAVHGRDGAGLDGIDGLNGRDGVIPPPPARDIDLFAHNDLGIVPIDLNLDVIEDIIGDIDTGVTITHGDGGAAVEADVLLAGIDIAHLNIPISPPVDIPVVHGLIDNLPGTDTLLQDPVGSLQGVAEGILHDVETLLQDPAGAVTHMLEQLSDTDAITSYASDLVFGITDGLTIAENVPVLGDTLDTVQSTLDNALDALPTGLVPDVGELLQDPASGLTQLAESLTDTDTLTGAVTGLVDDLPGVLAPVQELLSDPSALLTQLTDTGDLTGIVTNLLNGGNGDLPGGGDVLGGITDTGELTDTVMNLLGGGQPPAPGGDVDLVETNTLGLLPLNVNLDPVEAITGDIDLPLGITQDGIDIGNTVLAGSPLIPETHIPVDLGAVEDPAAVTDLVGGLLGQTPAPGGDTDLVETNNLGLPPLDIGLDPVEAITGDIDLVTSLTQDGDILDAGLTGVLLGAPLGDNHVPVDTSPLSNIASQITTGVENIASTAEAAAIIALPIEQIVTGSASGITDAIAAWPQPSPVDLGSIGGLASINAGEGISLPDPGGTISEGLGLLHHDDGHHGLLGHHGGGLFG